MERLQLWSCGGGRQSAGIAALIVEGRLPKPDHACMVALEWERKATYLYVIDYIRPTLLSLGIPFTFISRKQWALYDFLGGEDGKTVLLPSYTNQSGEASKLPEFCSGKWKQEACSRWAAAQSGWKDRGVDIWLGISWDERHRRRAARRQWLQPVYPLLDVAPMGVAGCLAAVERVGWPEPPRSRCYHCPNQSDGEWAELAPEEWELACKRDEWMRTIDPHAYLQKQMIPLRLVTLKQEEAGLFSGGCAAGMCY